MTLKKKRTIIKKSSLWRQKVVSAGKKVPVVPDPVIWNALRVRRAKKLRYLELAAVFFVGGRKRRLLSGSFA